MTYVQKLKYITLCLLTHMFYLMLNVLLKLNVLLLHYVTVHGLYFSISHLLCKAHQYLCDLTPINFKFHNGWKVWSKKRTVIQTARVRHSKKRSFEKRELFLRNPIWNFEGKKSDINEGEVKVIFLTRSISNSWYNKN